MLVLSDFSHYANHLLTDVYPLSRADFRTARLQRRASYSYINEIVEGAQDLTRHMLRRLLLPIPSTWSTSIRQAAKEGLLSADLLECLMILRPLRNRIIHENPAADADLAAFDHLPQAISAAFALFETWRAAASAAKSADVAPPQDVIVDRAYVLDAIRAEDHLTREKLLCELSWPSLIVARSEVWLKLRQPDGRCT